MPCDYSQYDPNWKFISKQTIVDAGNRCELCYAPNGELIVWDKDYHHPWRLAEAALADDPDYKVTKVVLTVHHINHDKTDNSKQNLICLCQRHHLRLDLAHHMANRRKNRAGKNSNVLPI